MRFERKLFVIMMLGIMAVFAVLPALNALAQQQQKQAEPEPEGDEDDLWGQEDAEPIRLQMVGIEVSPAVQEKLADTGAATKGGGYIAADEDLTKSVEKAVANVEKTVKKDEPKKEEEKQLEPKKEWYEESWFFIAAAAAGGVLLLIVLIVIVAVMKRKPAPVAMPAQGAPQPYPRPAPQQPQGQYNMPPQQAAPQQAAQPQQSGGTLVAAVFMPDGKPVPMMSSSVTVGSAPDNDIVFGDDPSIIPIHAKLAYEDGQYVVLNMGAEGSMLVNGQPVQKSAINTNDQLQVGSKVMVFGTTSI